MRRLALGLAAALLLGPVAAAGDPWSTDLSHDLMSPYCPGRTLHDCPSPQAEKLRLWIAAQEQGGRERGEVEQELYRVYGDEIRSAPRARGWGLTAYALPVAAMLAGGALLAVFLRRQVARAAAAPAPPPAAAAPGDRELEQLVDEELGGARR